MGRALILSFATLAELKYWAERTHWGVRRRRRLAHFLTGYAIHYPDRHHCSLWAVITAAAQRAGRPIGPADAWIAATAVFLNVTLVTHNPGDYAGVLGLTVISEAGA